MNDDDEHRNVHLDQPPITPHSCKHCQRIVLRREHFIDPNNRLMLPHTVSEIRHAARSGCDFFRLLASEPGPHHLLFCPGCTKCTGPQDWRINRLALLKRVLGSKKAEYPYNGIENIPSYWTKEAYKLKFMACWKRRRVSLSMNNYWGWAPPSLELSYHGSWEPIGIPLITQKVIGVEGKAASEVGTLLEQSYNADVASQSTLGQMYRWLVECHSSHTLCRQDHSSFVPRRLLHINFGTRAPVLRLVENGQSVQIRWAALSYVWGGGQKLKTTISSIADMKAGIGTERLPRTLQDAVTVCKAMCLEYLWVDSLCIIQDDPSDLAQELTSMPQIYQRSWVTISASTAANVSKGFLQERCYSHDQRPLSLSYLADDGLATNRIVFINFRTNSCLSWESPIHERAWTYQERRLSSRTLDFSDKGVIMYCHTNKRCQGYGSLMGWSAFGDTEDAKLVVRTERRLYKPVSEYQELPEWHDIVAGYVDRKLSFSSDKLIALSALASLYRQCTGYTYLAGLWKESLISDLCWRSAYHSLAPRPKEYRAPSWSWAAVDLTLHAKVPPDFKERLGPGGIYHENLKTAAHSLAKVIDVEIRQEPPNTTFGMIYEGFLTLEAPVLWTNWLYNTYLISFDLGIYDMDIKLGHHDARAFADTVEDQMNGNTTASSAVLAVLLMRSASVRTPRGNIYYGLVLDSVSENTYRRVGLFEFDDPNVHVDDECFRSLFNIRTITII